MAPYYLTIIGIFTWMVKLRRIDITTEVPLLSFYVALPREGHLDAAVHVMSHVGQSYNSRVVYDPSYPKTDHNTIKKYDWSEFY